MIKWMKEESSVCTDPYHGYGSLAVSRLKARKSGTRTVPYAPARDERATYPHGNAFLWKSVDDGRIYRSMVNVSRIRYFYMTAVSSEPLVTKGKGQPAF